MLLETHSVEQTIAFHTSYAACPCAPVSTVSAPSPYRLTTARLIGGGTDRYPAQVRKLGSVVIAATLIASIAGCGGDPTDTPAASAAPVNEQQSASPAAKKEPLTADAIIKKLEAAKIELTNGVAQTEDNDPNNLLGRPNGYTSRASADLPGGAKAGEKYSVDRGLVVEVFDSTDYIKGLQEESPILGTEWHYRTGDGTALVRVSGNVKPSLAKKVEAVVAEL